MNIQTKRIGLIMLASYFIFRFYFSFVSSSIQQILLFGFIGIYIVFHLPELKNYLYNLGRNKTIFLYVLFLYALTIAFSFLIPMLYQTYDLTYFKSQLRYVSYFLSFIVFVDLVRAHLQPKNLKDEVIRIYAIVCRNYVLVSVLMIAVPPLKYFWQSIIRETPRNLSLVNSNAAYIARWGWAGYSGFAITLQMTIAVAFVLYLLLKDIQNGKKISMWYFTTIIILLVGNSFYGRVGLLTSLGLIGLVILYLVFSKGKLLLGVGIIGSLIGLFMGLTLLKEFNSSIEGWYNWAMDPIIDIFQTGSIQTSSTDILLDMYFIPDIGTLLFGDGRYTDMATGGYYMSVDVGYIRPILFYGVFLLISGYLIPILLSYSLIRLDKKNTALAVLLLISMFIYELKGEVYMTIIPVCFMLFYAESVTAYESVSKNRKSKQMALFEEYSKVR